MERNSEKNKEACRRWREKNPEKVRAQNVRWPKENPEMRKASTMKWRHENIEKVRASMRKWYKNNTDRYREYAKKLKSTPKGKLKVNISSAICNSLQGKKNGRHWESLVGYTLEDLKVRLEKQFAENMTWNNYGKKGWTIDHKIPIAAFNFETPDDL